MATAASREVFRFQTILKLHSHSSLDYKACHGLTVKLSFLVLTKMARNLVRNVLQSQVECMFVKWKKPLFFYKVLNILSVMASIDRSMFTQ